MPQEAPAYTQRRLASHDPGESEIRLGDIRIVPDDLQVFVSERRVPLTVQEFDLLVILAKSAGTPISQTRLAQQLWQDVAPQRRRHLSVLVARLRQRLAGSRQYQVRTERKRGYGLMLPQLNRIEEIKLAKDGLDSLEDILRYARDGGEIEADDIERMKWYGVFYRRQTPGYFMLRLRIPNGILTSAQARAIGELSARFGRGKIDITTRQNIQLRWVRIQDVPVIFETLKACGLEYRQSGMDNVRNITGCPMAGLDPDEVLDASPIAQALQDVIVGNREFSNLPRKFNVSVSGCRHDCATSQIHDLSLTPAEKDGRVGFNVMVGGAGGSAPDLARDLDVFVTPQHAVALSVALIEMFRDKGNRAERQNGRLRWLRQELGLTRLRAELEAAVGPLERAGESLFTSYCGDHLGVSFQKQAGLNTVGCLVPVGRIQASDLVEFGRLAEAYGSGELRLTNNQNLLIVNVPDARLPALLQEALQKYPAETSSWMRRTTSCTGKDFCHFALIDTKGAAVTLSQRLDELLPGATPLRVHWSGCSRGCGQHHIGEIGLQAAQVRVGESIIDAADVFLGGRLGADPRLATKVLDAVPLDQLPERIAELLSNR